MIHRTELWVDKIDPEADSLEAMGVTKTKEEETMFTPFFVNLNRVDAYRPYIDFEEDSIGEKTTIYLGGQNFIINTTTNVFDKIMKEHFLKPQ